MRDYRTSKPTISTMCHAYKDIGIPLGKQEVVKCIPYNLLQSEVYTLREKVDNLAKMITLLRVDNTLLLNQSDDKSIPNQAEDSFFGRRRDLTGDTLQYIDEGEGKVHPFGKPEDKDA